MSYTNWSSPVDGEHNLFIYRSKCNVFTKSEHQNLLPGSWWELPVLLRCYRANIKLTFLQQGKQFNCVPSKLFVCSGYAVSQVKEGRPARSVGRSVVSCSWVITRGTTPGHYFVCVNEGSLVRCRTRQGIPNFQCSRLNYHCHEYSTCFLVKRKVISALFYVPFFCCKVWVLFIFEFYLTASAVLHDFLCHSLCCEVSFA
jgi:hypothetical protein